MTSEFWLFVSPPPFLPQELNPKGVTYELKSSKLGKTDIHKFYFRIYMQLNLFFLKRGNENVGKTLTIFLPTYRTYQVRYFQSFDWSAVTYRLSSHPFKFTSLLSSHKISANFKFKFLKNLMQVIYCSLLKHVMKR